MRALITGAAGFVGSHLADLLVAKGYCVAAADRDVREVRNLRSVIDRVSLHECDVRDPKALADLVSRVQPDEVYHLAAIASVSAAVARPRLAIEVNVVGTLNLLEAVRTCRPEAKVLCVGSAHEYGEVRETDMPIGEGAPLLPVDPYGVSKVCAGLLAYQYHKTYGMCVFRSRAFNHVGPRQSPDFAVASFAKQIAEIEAGLRPAQISVGNLDAKRDFTDVRDVAHAYWTLVQHGTPGEVYNVCSGQAVALHHVLQGLLGMSSVEVEIVPDVRRLRRADLSVLVGDSSRLTAATGWQPRIAIEQTLGDTLDYWRAEVVHAGK